MNPEVNRFICLSLDNKMVKPCEAHLRGEKTAAVRGSDETGQGRFSGEMDSGGRGGEGSHKQSRADKGHIVRSEGIRAGFHVVVQEIHIQAPSPHEFLSQFNGDGRRFYRPVCQINIGNFTF